MSFQNPSNRVEAYFWDVLDNHHVRIRLREKFFDMDSVENRVFHVCRSFTADIRLVLLEFLEDRPEWKDFPGYELLQYAYRVQPFPANKSNVHFDPVQVRSDAILPYALRQACSLGPFCGPKLPLVTVRLLTSLLFRTSTTTRNGRWPRL